MNDLQQKAHSEMEEKSTHASIRVIISEWLGSQVLDSECKSFSSGIGTEGGPQEDPVRNW